MRTILIASFTASIVTGLIGAWMRISHMESSDFILVTAIGSWMVFVAVAIYEILSSQKIDRMEKILWTLGLIFISMVTGLAYLLAGRRRVANHS